MKPGLHPGFREMMTVAAFNSMAFGTCDMRRVPRDFSIQVSVISVAGCTHLK